jgi:hypothetical protein
MNPLTFNDVLNPSIDFTSESFGVDVYPNRIPNSILTSPIFLFDNKKDHPCTLGEFSQRIKTQPDILPFRTMRLCITPGWEPGSKNEKLWLHHDRGVLHALYSIAYFDARIKANEMVLAIMTHDKDAGIWGFIRHKNRVHTYDKTPEDERESFGEHMQRVATIVNNFIFECSSQSNFVASVEPKHIGRSVEWVRARTHYVILNHTHPVNRKEVTPKGSLAATSVSIKRQAHSRRAHDKVLRHPYFKNKIGQTIRVKATWVGPSEWEQEGSIYKMLKRPPASSTPEHTQG